MPYAPPGSAIGGGKNSSSHSSWNTAKGQNPWQHLQGPNGTGLSFKETEEISRNLSRILRYEWKDLGLYPDSDGFLSLDDLIREAKLRNSTDEVIGVAQSSSGSRGARFEVRHVGGAAKVKAMYAHGPKKGQSGGGTDSGGKDSKGKGSKARSSAPDLGKSVGFGAMNPGDWSNWPGCAEASSSSTAQNGWKAPAADAARGKAPAPSPPWTSAGCAEASSSSTAQTGWKAPAANAARSKAPAPSPPWTSGGCAEASSSSTAQNGWKAPAADAARSKAPAPSPPWMSGGCAEASSSSAARNGWKAPAADAARSKAPAPSPPWTSGGGAEASSSSTAQNGWKAPAADAARSKARPSAPSAPWTPGGSMSADEDLPLPEIPPEVETFFIGDSGCAPQSGGGSSSGSATPWPSYSEARAESLGGSAGREQRPAEDPSMAGRGEDATQSRSSLFDKLGDQRSLRRGLRDGGPGPAEGGSEPSGAVAPEAPAESPAAWKAEASVPEASSRVAEARRPVAERWSRYTDPKSSRPWFHNEATEEHFFEDRAREKGWEQYTSAETGDWWWHEESQRYFYESSCR